MSEAKRNVKIVEGDNEGRMSVLGDLITGMVFTRFHYIKPKYNMMTDRFIEFVRMIGLNEREAQMSSSNGSIRVVDDRGLVSRFIALQGCVGFGIKNGIQMVKNLYSGESVRWEDHCVGEKLPDVFDNHTIVSWHIGDLKKDKIDRLIAGHGECPPEVIHLARLIVGWLANDIPLRIRKTIVDQLKEFVKTGTISLNKPETINPKDRLSWPGGLLSLEGNNKFVHKHGRYCEGCGEKITGCFCTDYGEEIDLVERDYVCSNCVRSRVEPYLLKALKDRQNIISSILCEHDDEFTEWLHGETNGDFIKYDEKENEYRWKIISKDDLKKFWDLYWNYLWDSGGDPPEDSCACPTWGA